MRSHSGSWRRTPRAQRRWWWAERGADGAVADLGDCGVHLVARSRRQRHLRTRAGRGFRGRQTRFPSFPNTSTRDPDSERPIRVSFGAEWRIRSRAALKRGPYVAMQPKFFKTAREFERWHGRQPSTETLLLVGFYTVASETEREISRGARRGAGARMD